MCANLLNLQKDIEEMDRAGMDMYHIDIMDGHFVPNLCLNFDIIKLLRGITATPMDVHLMVEDPEKYMGRLKELKVEYCSFHMEATRYPIRLLKSMKDIGIKAGLAVNPSTCAEALSYVIPYCDYVLVMTVEPGFAGQKFITEMLDKIQSIKKIIRDKNPECLIMVDGNISEETAEWCIEMGADILVAGSSSVFRKDKGLYEASVEFKAHTNDYANRKVKVG